MKKPRRDKWSPPLRPRLPLQPLGAYSRIEYERICEHGVSVSLCREGCGK